MPPTVSTDLVHETGPKVPKAMAESQPIPDSRAEVCTSRVSA
jgi:hypothetical protein